MAEYTTAKAAELVDRSEETLKRWRRMGLCQPSSQRFHGKVMEWMYTEDDITKLRNLAHTIKSGPKGPRRN